MDQVILQFFQSIRHPALTVVFGAFSILGEAAVIGILAVFLYWLYDRAGEQILCTLLTSVPVNCLAKAAISRPRPYIAGDVTKLDPPLSLSSLGDSLSFPSGHAQASASFYGAAAFSTRRARVWIISFLAMILIACSRLYFGVHYPTDVIAGILFGILIAILWALVFAHLPRARYYLLSVFALIMIVAAFFLRSSDFLRATGLIAGGAFFLPIADAVKGEPAKDAMRLWRVPVGLGVCAVMFAINLLLPDGEGYIVLKWFLLTGAATLGAQFLFRAFQI